MNWFGLGEFSLIAGLLTGLIGYIFRLFIKHSFTQELEEFKANLKNESFKYTKTFEVLHTERALVVEKMYRMMVKTHKSFDSLMCPVQMLGELTENEKLEEASKNANSLVKYYELNRLYFAENDALEIDNYLKILRETWVNFNGSKNKTNGNRDARIWTAAWTSIRDGDAAKSKVILEKVFRVLIGVEEAENLY